MADKDVLDSDGHVMDDKDHQTLPMSITGAGGSQELSINRELRQLLQGKRPRRKKAEPLERPDRGRRLRNLKMTKSWPTTTSERSVGIDLESTWKQFKDFEDCRRILSVPVSDFIKEWESQASMLMTSECCLYSDLGLAFKLLRQANLDSEQLQQVLLLMQVYQADPDANDVQPAVGHLKAKENLPFLCLTINYLQSQSVATVKEEPVLSDNKEDMLEDDKSFELLTSVQVEEDSVESKEESNDSDQKDFHLFSTYENDEDMDMPELDSSNENDDENDEKVDENDDSPHVKSRRSDKLMRSKKSEADLKKKIRQSCTCPDCGKVFSRSTHLRRHRELHTKPVLRFKCELCQVDYKVGEEYTNHLDKIHPAVTLFNCPVCKLSLKDKSSLSNHLVGHETSSNEDQPKENDDSKQKAHMCPECGKTFKRGDHVKRHMELHLEGQEFMCSVCGRRFARAVYLKNHMKHHSGETPFQCYQCGKSYAEKSSLKKHLLSHKEERPCVCEACGKGFPTKYQLTRHKAIHTGLKPHKCEICDQAFLERSKLKKHIIRLHTGERPHKCKLCEKAFATTENLRQHEKTHIPKDERPPQKKRRRNNNGVKYAKVANVDVFSDHKVAQAFSNTVKTENFPANPFSAEVGLSVNDRRLRPEDSQNWHQMNRILEHVQTTTT